MNRYLPWLGWLIAALCCLLQFLLQTSSSVMINGLENDFSLNAFSVSLLTSSYYITYFLFQLPSGIWLDYIKPRRTLFLSQLMVAIFFFLFSQSNNFWIAYVSRLFVGIAAAPVFVTAFYLIAKTLPSRLFAFMAGLTETMAMAGGLMGQSLLARSVSAYGWRHTVAFMSFLALVMAVLSLLILKDDLIKDHDHDEPKNTISLRQKIKHDFAQLFFEPQAWINGLYCGLLFGVIGAFGSFWCVSFLMAAYQTPIHRAADISSMIFIGAAIGTPAVGWIAEKLNAKRLFMIGSAILATIILIFIIYFPPQSLTTMGWLILLLGFFSSSYVLPFAVIRDITPSSMRGTAMGYINSMCILIGAPIMLPLIGALLNGQTNATLPTYQNALIVVPLSSFFGFILAFFVREKREQDLSSERL